MYDAFAGIDIGRHGAIAIIQNTKILVYPMPSKKNKTKFFPDGRKILEIITSFPRNTFITVESQQPYKGQGLISSFTLARYYESVLTSVEIAGINYKEAHPKTWKHKYGLDEDKIKSLIKLAYFYPETFKRYIKKNSNGGYNADQDGMAEAVLLADYGKNHLNK